MKQKRTLSADPSTRKAKGQPRGRKKANAPTLPSTIKINFSLFVTFVLTLSMTPFTQNSG
ncbi:hypothetical protein QNI16_02460 [Cytophagaceae bacterium YF14B1]|uniref:Uncharacterized protein n=1 Tax=Xanthocytophaga flava TaxID=3048013 RepID=A0AAE3U757_9BACT|nr:hypothetical protein [Xanthocytophaga flavus]MDJ1479329.1 hypothetical protein [Xanthocytophaga flavus]